MEKKTKLVLEAAEKLLRSHEIEAPKLETELLLSHIFSCSRIDLYKKQFDAIDESSDRQFQDLLKRRCQKEPIAYLLGFREFCGYLFSVTQDTLIPRPETELLVEEVSSFLKKRNLSSAKIADLGTGTGCIALSLGKLHQETNIIGFDKSSGAIQVAKKNQKHLELNQERICFSKGDLLSEDFWKNLGSFDVIVSNPPYIGLIEEKDLSLDVKGFEPSMALFAGEEGLDFYEIFALKAKEHLNPLGQLFLELSPVIYEKVCAIFIEKGWTLVKTREDYAGHKRHIILA